MYTVRILYTCIECCTCTGTCKSFDCRHSVPHLVLILVIHYGALNFSNTISLIRFYRDEYAVDEC